MLDPAGEDKRHVSLFDFQAVGISMRPFQTSAAACVLVALAAPVAAEDCDHADLTQSGLDACYGASLAKAEAALERKYTRILDCLKAPDDRPLVEAQRAWVTFRDLECRFQAGPAGEGAGSVRPMVEAICKRNLTDTRSKELDYYLTCAEGDFSCPTFSCKFPERKP